MLCMISWSSISASSIVPKAVEEDGIAAALPVPLAGMSLSVPSPGMLQVLLENTERYDLAAVRPSHKAWVFRFGRPLGLKSAQTN